MGKLLLVILLLLSAHAHGDVARGQTAEATSGATQADPDITAARVSGEVVTIDLTGKQMTVKTAAGSVVAVTLDDRTAYLHVPPGEVTLEKAVSIPPGSIGVGDRVIARGKVSEDKKSVPARQVIVMTKADLALKGEREREEWRRRGIAGRIAEVRPTEREIVAVLRSGAGEQRITLGVPAGVVLRRLAPGAVKFSDAGPSSFEELKVGDHIRALGERSPDGSRYTPEEIISGSFRMVGGPLKAIDPAAGELTLDNLEDGRPVTVTVTRDSMLRRVPPDLVALIARRKAQDEAAAAGGARPPQGVQPAPGGQANADIQELIERLPQLSLSELKVGETLVVSSTAGPDPARVTGIIVAAGLDPLLKPAKARGTLKSTSGGTSLGLPSGVLDGGAGGP
jgi:hypothetical protein